ncbi:hypothetical protein D3C72_275870 [compost metagenome]
MIGVFAAVTLLGATQILGEPKEPMTVEVDHRGDDAGGEQLAFLLRERLRGSSSFSVLGEGAFYKIVIDSVDMSSVTLRPSTSYSVVILADQSSQSGYPEGYITSKVGYCEVRLLAECATQEFIEAGTQIDEADQDMRRRVNEAVEEFMREIRP